jgi:predicted branched-subunit amino acid permease
MFLLGAGLTLWVTWQSTTAIGIFLGGQVPRGWSLDFALPLTFIAIVLPMMRNRVYVAAAVVAGVLGVVAYGLPYKLGYIVAAGIAIVVGFVMESRWKQR